MLHGSTSVTLPHTEQKCTAACMLVMASANSRTVSGGWRRRWKVSRCAVLGPMPGRLANASTARAIGSIVCTRALRHAGELHAARERAKLVGGGLLGLAE